MSAKEIIAIIVILIATYVAEMIEGDPDIRTPRETPERAEEMPVPPSHPLPGDRGPRIYVEPDGAPSNSTGTAFAIGDAGLWITARHVISGCDTLVFAPPGLRRARRGGPAWIHPNSDMALVKGPQPAAAFRLAPRPPGNGEDAFHIGFPQGKPGDVWSQVIGKARLVTSGRHRSEEPVTVYAERKRYPAFSGSLGGMSGGPIFNAMGQVVGVTVTENRRRGRITGTAPRSFAKLFETAGTRPTATKVTAPNLSSNSLKAIGDRLRREFLVSRLLCFVD